MKNEIKKLTLGAVMAALALSIGYLEGLIPQLPFLPPGAKPGFSNIIVMFALDSLNVYYAFAIVALKAVFALITRGVTA